MGLINFKALDLQDELDARYPNRQHEIHKAPCKHCPSTMATDPMEQEYDDFIKSLPKEIIAKEYAFVCGWRQSKLCKGFCDNMGLTPEDVKLI